MRLSRRTLGCGLVALLAAPEARAHARLVAATPKNGAVLARAPERVVLRFSGGVERRFARVSLASDGGKRTALVLEGDEGAGLVRELAARLPKIGAGTHVVHWNVVAADGHRVSGRVRFSVQA